MADPLPAVGTVLVIADRDWLWDTQGVKAHAGEVVVVERRNMRGIVADTVDVVVVRTGQRCCGCSPSRFKPLPKET